MELVRTVLLALALVACGRGSSTEQTTLDSIPRAAAAALQAQAGTAQIQRVSQIDGDRELYEGSWWEGGLEREAKVTEDGELVELEIQLRETDVPPPVRFAAVQKLAGARSIKYLLVGTHYEAEAIINGRFREARFTAAGQRVGKDDDDDDDEDDDEDEDEDDDD